MKGEKMKQKSITELLIDLENCRRKLEEVQKPESEYIERKTKEIFGNKKYYDREKVAADIEKILANF